MMKLNVLIIGGNGFIGSNLSKILVQKGHNVTIFDSNITKKEVPAVEYIVGDFFNTELIKEIVEPYDIVVHAVSTISPGTSTFHYMHAYSNDIVQSVRLCEICTKKRIVFLSSGGTVYGEQEVQPIREDACPNPINHYGSVKLSIENAMRVFIRYGLNACIARIANPYGPGQDFSRGVGFIDAVVKKSLIGEPIEIYGNGLVVRDYIYIDDVCEYLCWIMTDDSKYDIFNISTGVGISQVEVIKHIKALGLKPKIKYIPERSVDVKKVVLSNERICNVSGIYPRLFADGISNFVNN